MDILGALPVELARLVMGFLPAVDLANCCKVSSRWRELANDDALWRRLLYLDGFKNEILVPLPDFEGGESELEMECRYKLLYDRGGRAVAGLRRNRVSKGQADGSSAGPLGNGDLLAVLSSRKPYLTLHRLSSGLRLLQTIALPRLKCSIQTVYTSPRFLVVEMYPSAFVCYGLTEGRLGLRGIIHAIDGELKSDREPDDGGTYSAGGFSVLGLVDDTLVLREEPEGLVFVGLDPFRRGATVSLGPEWRGRASEVAGRLCLADEACVRVWDTQGRPLGRLDCPAGPADRRLLFGDGPGTGLLAVVFPGGGEAGGCALWLKWPVAGVTEAAPSAAVTLPAGPPLAAGGMTALSVVHCTACSLRCVELPSGSLLWTVPLEAARLSAARQFFALPHGFLVLRSDEDYTVFDSRDGRELFSNREKPECGLIHRHDNPRAFVFFDALFFRMIIHVFSP